MGRSFCAIPIRTLDGSNERNCLDPLLLQTSSSSPVRFAFIHTFLPLPHPRRVKFVSFEFRGREFCSASGFSNLCFTNKRALNSKTINRNDHKRRENVSRCQPKIQTQSLIVGLLLLLLKTKTFCCCKNACFSL